MVEGSLPPAPPGHPRPLRIGCCGWSYREWVGPFYRSAEKMLTQYARVFDLVEMDSTFYRVPEERTMRGIASTVPRRFRFTVKLPGTVTHDEFVRDTPRAREALADFGRAVAPLQERGLLLLVLVQLAPSFSSDGADDLERLLGELRDRGLRTATEFRHASWIEESELERTLSLLRREGSSYTVVDEPLLPPVIHKTAQPIYVRLHGRNPEHWYDYEYSEGELAEWSDRIRGLVDEGEEVLVVFNNHPHGYAPRNAQRFSALMGLTRRGNLENFPLSPNSAEL